MEEVRREESQAWNKLRTEDRAERSMRNKGRRRLNMDVNGQVHEEIKKGKQVCICGNIRSYQ